MKAMQGYSAAFLAGVLFLAGCGDHKPVAAPVPTATTAPAPATTAPVSETAAAAAPLAAARVKRVGPASLYPKASLTPGLSATLSMEELTKKYTEGCSGGKTECTYSDSHRDVKDSVHTKVYDLYKVAPDRRNFQSGEVDHLFPMCAGGSNDIRNLWYQPAVNLWKGKNYGFHEKDHLESWVCLQIKAGKLDPKDAFDRITKDWVAFYLAEHLDQAKLGMDADTD